MTLSRDNAIILVASFFISSSINNQIINKKTCKIKRVVAIPLFLIFYNNFLYFFSFFNFLEKKSIYKKIFKLFTTLFNLF